MKLLKLNVQLTSRLKAMVIHHNGGGIRKLLVMLPGCLKPLLRD